MQSLVHLWHPGPYFLHSELEYLFWIQLNRTEKQRKWQPQVLLLHLCAFYHSIMQYFDLEDHKMVTVLSPAIDQICFYCLRASMPCYAKISTHDLWSSSSPSYHLLCLPLWSRSRYSVCTLSMLMIQTLAFCSCKQLCVLC